CINCWAGSNGLTNTSANGFRIDNGDGIMLITPRVVNSGCHGIVVSSTVTNLEIAGGIVTGNSQSGTNTCQGIVMSGNSGFRIHDVKTGQAAGQGNFQSWGIFVVAGSDRYVISGNDTTGNVVGGINNVPGTSSTRIVANNLGYVQ